MSSLFVCIWMIATVDFVGGNLYNSLKYYEVLDHVNIFTRSKRSVDDAEEGLTRELTFHAFNRTFTCILRPRTEIFAPGFKVIIVHSNQTTEVIRLPEGNFFQGKLVGVEDSEVHGYFEDEMFTGTVLLLDELLVIEPAWRHIHEEGEAINGQMIAYRVSDMTWQRDHKAETSSPFCASVHAEQGKSQRKGEDMKPTRGFPARWKRSTPTWNTCQIVAVADYKFYQAMGGSDIYRTATYMVGVIERVDAIYKSTVWNSNGLTGLGFEIKTMRIHLGPTTPPDGDIHYNMAKTDWDVLELLQAFSRDLTFQDYCVAHLFTYQSFANNVMGLGYIASPKVGTVGGICSGVYDVDGVTSSLNTGLSSSRNQNGDAVLTQMADLVTAHGHNWGSEHDPDSGDCAPNSITGDGKYLMYPFSVSGGNLNNYKFSSCSKILVDQVLQSKGSSCFKERSVQALCGNGVIDEGEECDAGYLAKFGIDECCSSSCQLVANAECSPVNKECCVGCKIASIGYLCSSDNNITCTGASYCVYDCPPAPQKADGTACLDGGQCRNGVCEAFCEARGKISCICSEVATSCFRCCRDNTTSPCEPYNSIDTLPNGRPCVQGYCSQGLCKKTVQNTIERFFNIIESLTIDGVIQFFRDNVIGAVMVFSLIVWIPICIGIKIYDYRRKKWFEEDMYREIKKDRDLVYDEDGRHVKKPIMSEDSPRLRELKPSELLAYSP